MNPLGLAARMSPLGLAARMSPLGGPFARVLAPSARPWWRERLPMPKRIVRRLAQKRSWLIRASG